MASFPLVCNFQGDYGMKLLVVDSQDTMDGVAQKAKDLLVGVVVKPLKSGTVLRVTRHGEGDYLPSRMRKYSPPNRVIFFGEDSLFT